MLTMGHGYSRQLSVAVSYVMQLLVLAWETTDESFFHLLPILRDSGDFIVHV